MRRGLLLAPLLIGAALALAGCSTTGDPAAVPVRLAAPPQTAQLDWLEPFPAEKPALVFGVASFRVTDNGWSADISVANRSEVGWKIVERNDQAALQFGLMLFPNGDQDEFEHLSTLQHTRATRPATSYTPALPVSSNQGARGGNDLRARRAPWRSLGQVCFRPFSSVGEPPKGVPASAITWYTDHAYHLEEVAAVPA